MEPSKRLVGIIAQAIKAEDEDGFVINEADTCERLAHVVLQALEDADVLVAEKPVKVYAMYGGEGGPIDTPELYWKEEDAKAAYQEHVEECGVELDEEDEEAELGEEDWSCSEYTYSWDEVEIK